MLPVNQQSVQLPPADKSISRKETHSENTVTHLARSFRRLTPHPSGLRPVPFRLGGGQSWEAPIPEADLEKEEALRLKQLARAEEQKLILAVKAGDAAAFQTLVNKYKNQVYSHCYRMVNDEEESNDLSQEVFLKVFRYIQKYEHTYSFYTWLYRITVNSCIDYLRKKRRHPNNVSLSHGYDNDPSEVGKDQDYPDFSMMPDKHLHTLELNGVLSKAIGELSEKLRVIIVMKEIDGMSYDEIADILKCSRGTVKSRLFRARERLKELLSPYFDGEAAG